MRNQLRFGLVGLLLFAFQNCGRFAAVDRSIVYPYSTQPDFFYDLKLVSVEMDDLGRKNYEFDVVMSYAKDIDQALNYRISFSTLDRSGICQSQDRTASGEDKHQRFVCLLPTPDDLYVQLKILGPSNEEEVQQYRF